MISTFAIHPAASKYMIAKSVVKLPQVQKALTSGKIFIGNGTTNIRIVEQLLDIKINELEKHVAGVITQKVACATEKENRLPPWCIDHGQLIETDWLDFVNELGPDDVFIKGANAVDPSGNVGILLGDAGGGTIGKTIGMLKARGIEIITPVGLEKLIPSCLEAQKNMGIYKTEYRLGLKVGYIVLSNTTLVTEIESLKILFGIDAVMIAAGGVGGMEGSVMLAAKCQDEQQASSILDFIKEANKEKLLKINKKLCKNCTAPCRFKE